MKSILFRLPAAVKDQMEARAKAGAMTVSTYIRRLIYRDLKLPLRDAVLRQGRK